METLIERAPAQIEGEVEDEVAMSDAPLETAASGGSSSRWRSLWRLHFYGGIFSMPFILLMAITGLVILYSQPIHDLMQGNIRAEIWSVHIGEALGLDVEHVEATVRRAIEGAQQAMRRAE